MSTTRGKYGVLEMDFEVDECGKTILRHLHREVPIIVQQALYFDEQLPSMACIYMLSSGGPQLGGDRYSVDVALSAGAMAHISTGAASLVAPMNEDESSRWRWRLTLEADSYLELLPLGITPCARSAYHSTTEIVIDPSATLITSEVISCGRLHSGERFDYRELELTTTLCRPSGEVLARDGIHLTPSLLSPEEAPLLGDFTHFGSVLILAPPTVVATLYGALPPVVTPDLRLSCLMLRDGCGLSLRLLAHSCERLLGEIRTLASMVRLHSHGVHLQAEFPWR